MTEILNRFSLEAAKFNGQIFLSLLLIWFALVYCAVTSIRSQGFSERQRRLWVWIIICVPLLGLLAYLPFSVRREDLPQVFLMKIHKDRALKKVKSAPSARSHLCDPATRAWALRRPSILHAKDSQVFGWPRSPQWLGLLLLALAPATLPAQQTQAPQFQ